MVVSISDPLVANPLAFVKHQFASRLTSDSVPSTGNGSSSSDRTRSPCSDATFVDVRETFLPYLEGDLKDQVPCLNGGVNGVSVSAATSPVPSGTLVRYVGMVRDMLNPEYYTGAYKVARAQNTNSVGNGNGTPGSSSGSSGSEWQTTKYEDFAGEDLSLATETVMWERRPLFCVAVPGENKWVAGTEGEEEAGGIDDDTAMVTSASAGGAGGDVGGKKRRHEEVNDVVMEDMNACPTCPACPKSKRSASSPSSSSGSGSGSGSFFNPNRGSFPCLVKVYENSGLENVKLNDVIEVVGVLSCDPRLTIWQSGQYQEGEEVTEEDMANNPPASKVPRVHVIVGRKVQCYQNALAGIEKKFVATLAAGGREDFRQSQGRLLGLRDQAVRVLSKSLRGDTLAAEYLLLHLLSSAQRDPSNPEQVLGKHALNIYKCPSQPQSQAEVVGAVNATLERLVPRSKMIEMSLEKLNEKPMWPRKDYRVNRLLGGPLLLAERTHLLLDETRLTTGQLQAAGLLNYNCLKSLLTFQSIEVDFQYYKLPIHCNIPILVLSDTKSLLPCDTAVALQPQEEERAATEMNLTEEDMTELRYYLCSIQLLEYAIPSNVSDFLQQEFVAQRQKDPTNTNADSFHRLLTLARLVTQSFGEKELTVERWRQLCRMEELRMQRQQQQH